MQELTRLRSAAQQTLRTGEALAADLAEREALSETAKVLKETARRKQAEAAESKGFSARNLLLRITKKLEDTVEREEGEARRAAAEYDLAAARLDTLSARIQNLWSETEPDTVTPYCDALALKTALGAEVQAARETYGASLHARKLFFELAPLAEKLSALLEEAHGILVNGDRLTTPDGHTLNCTMNTLLKQLPACQQALDEVMDRIARYNEMLPEAALEKTPPEPCGGDYLSGRCSDFELESHLSLCRKWVKRLAAETVKAEPLLAREIQAKRAALCGLLFTAHEQL